MAKKFTELKSPFSCLVCGEPVELDNYKYCPIHENLSPGIPWWQQPHHTLQDPDYFFGDPILCFEDLSW